jgi:hypothetical protein
MNNEPVAWMNAHGEISVEEHWAYPTPLYTHPAKEQYKFGVDWSKDGNAVTVLKVYEGGVAEVVFTDYQEVLNVPSNTCKHGVDDGACKECYVEAQEK